MRTAEAVSLLFILFCRDPQFRRALYKLDPVLVRRLTNGEGSLRTMMTCPKRRTSTIAGTAANCPA